MLTDREERLIKNRKLVYFALGFCILGYVALAIFLIFQFITSSEHREEAIKYLVLIGLLNSTVMIYYIGKLYEVIIKLKQDQKP